LGEFPTLFNPGSPTIMCTILFLVAFQGLFCPLYIDSLDEFKDSMLNPDGVFMGNYRTGVLGDDFNRKFATGKK
jgi:hypothetical protein